MSYSYTTLLTAMGKMNTPYATLEKYEYDALLEAAREHNATALEIQGMLKTEKDYGYPHFRYIPGRSSYRDEYYEVLGILPSPSSSYSSYSPSGYNSGGGCYLTTACMKHRAEGDFDDEHCYELQVLRKFREEFMKPTYPEEVDEYYKFAPKLVDAINAREDADQIYEGIYYDMVLKSVRAVEDRRMDDARAIYVGYSSQLRNKYLAEKEGG